MNDNQRQRRYPAEEPTPPPKESRTLMGGRILLTVMVIGIAIMEMFVIYLVIRNVFFD